VRRLAEYLDQVREKLPLAQAVENTTQRLIATIVVRLTRIGEASA
jgi:hypothetical protein